MSQQCLQRGMLSCHNRETYMKLCMQTYEPALSNVHLPEFASFLVAGRDIQTAIDPIFVKLDQSLCTLVLDNAITNAFKHGDPSDPAVQFSIRRGPERSDSANASIYRVPHSDSGQSNLSLDHDGQGCSLVFCVSNRSHPAQTPLNKRSVAELFEGRSSRPVRALSDRIGMQHIWMAAEVIGMAVTLETRGDRVVFEAQLCVEKTVGPSVAANSGSQDCELPEGLHYCCIDDSPSQRRLLHHALNAQVSPASVVVFGETVQDVEAFVTETMAHADIAILDQVCQPSRYDPGVTAPRGGVPGAAVHPLRQLLRG